MTFSIYCHIAIYCPVSDIRYIILLAAYRQYLIFETLIASDVCNSTAWFHTIIRDVPISMAGVNTITNEVFIVIYLLAQDLIYYLCSIYGFIRPVIPDL